MYTFSDFSEHLTKRQKMRLILSDRQWHSTQELVNRIGHTFGCTLYQLRQNGFVIKRQKHPVRKHQHQYRLISSSRETTPQRSLSSP